MLYSLERLEAEAAENRAAAGILFNARDLVAYGMPQADGAEIIKAVKQVFILRGAGKAAEWAFESIPGFALTLNRAKERVRWIIDAEKCGEAAIDKAADKIRDRNRKRIAG